MKKKPFEIRKQRILPGYEHGQFEPRRQYDRADFKTPPHDAMRRDNRVSIRIAGSDLSVINKLALEKGIPTQTLLANIIHRYVTGELKENPLEEQFSPDSRDNKAEGQVPSTDKPGN